MKPALLSEFVGTFVLVFAGTGAIVVNDVQANAITHVGIAFTFGLVVMAMIYTIGGTSGAHMNPAVTLGLATSGKFAWQNVLPYIVAQALGALLASIALLGMFPEHPNLGATIPSGSPIRSWILEAILTAILMIAVLSFSNASAARASFAGIAIGGVIGLEAMFAGPISGASMNPARSLAPAIMSGNLEHIWIYLSAPIFGALIGVLISQQLFSDEPS